MNARGKQLTDFENFKADLMKWILSKENPQAQSFEEIVDYDGRKMSNHLAIGIKLDNDWTRLFWHYTKDTDYKTPRGIDKDYIRFWNRFFLHHYIAKNKFSADVLEKNSEFFRTRYFSEDGFKYKGFEDYARILIETGLIQRAENVLDGLSNYHVEINELLKPSWNPSFGWQLFDKGITQPQRIIYFAITRFLESGKYNKVMFSRWIRVVWNLAIDPDLRSIPITIRIIRVIDKISIGAHDIYQFLTSEEYQKLISEESSFAKTQLIEEALKAELILSNFEWEEAIILAESHPLFNGNIGFLINDRPSLEQFKHRTRQAEMMFSGSGPKGKFSENYRLIRATIARIEKWSDLEDLNLKDHQDNWRLMLRRNENIQETIRSFCDLADVDLQRKEMDRLVSAPSTISGWNNLPTTTTNARHIHENLFMPAPFHKWLQTLHDEKAIELKSFDERVYVHRPNSWYDRVMIETYRNELITEMCSKFGFTTPNQCSDSNFYWDYIIPLECVFLEKFTLKADILNHRTLQIGLSNTYESELIGIEMEEESKEEDWLFIKKYRYDNLYSQEDVAKLISTINHDFFDLTNEHSLVCKLNS